VFHQHLRADQLTKNILGDDVNSGGLIGFGVTFFSRIYILPKFYLDHNRKAVKTYKNICQKRENNLYSVGLGL